LAFQIRILKWLPQNSLIPLLCFIEIYSFARTSRIIIINSNSLSAFLKGTTHFSYYTLLNLRMANNYSLQCIETSLPLPFLYIKKAFFKALSTLFCQLWTLEKHVSQSVGFSPEINFRPSICASALPVTTAALTKLPIGINI
jgi:hypothetical protein